MTICSGKSYLVNGLDKAFITAAATALHMEPTTSGHLNYVSTRIG